MRRVALCHTVLLPDMRLYSTLISIVSSVVTNNIWEDIPESPTALGVNGGEKTIGVFLHFDDHRCGFDEVLSLSSTR